MANNDIQVKAQASGFGAQVSGVDISKPLSQETMTVLKSAWAKHAVLSFPEQHLAHTELEAFTLNWGEFGHDPFVKALDDHIHILEVRRDAAEKASNFGAGWHSDWSFQVQPPAATLLHSKVIPPVGGDTLYADCKRAYYALSPAMQGFLDGLTVVHSAASPYGSKGFFAQEEKGSRAMQIITGVEADKTHQHPLVRTHPVTGQKALYVSPTYSVTIAELAADESAALLGFLYNHINKEEFIYRHQWQANMLVIWDNRCTVHQAQGGYDGHLRVLHRTTVAGEVPC